MTTVSESIGGMLISADEQAVLGVLTRNWAYPLRIVAEQVSLPIERVKTARLRLRDKGLAVIGECYNDDDGTFNGSGYFLTRKGAEIQETATLLSIGLEKSA